MKLIDTADLGGFEVEGGWGKATGDACWEYLPRFAKQKSTIHVGEYTSPMEHFGFVFIVTSLLGGSPWLVSS